jgi:hypothetical protein
LLPKLTLSFFVCAVGFHDIIGIFIAHRYMRKEKIMDRTMNNDVQHVTSSEATHRIGEQMETLAGKVREKAPAEGSLGTAASSVADKLEGAGAYLQEKGFDDMVEDLTALVRRYPMQSLLIGMGLGYLLGRNTNR